MLINVIVIKKKTCMPSWIEFNIIAHKGVVVLTSVSYLDCIYAPATEMTLINKYFNILYFNIDFPVLF